MKMKSELLTDLLALHKIRRKVDATHTQKIQVCIDSHLEKAKYAHQTLRKLKYAHQTLIKLKPVHKGAKNKEQRAQIKYTSLNGVLLLFGLASHHNSLFFLHCCQIPPGLLGQFSQKNSAPGEKIRPQTDTPEISTFIQYSGFT